MAGGLTLTLISYAGAVVAFLFATLSLGKVPQKRMVSRTQ
jgi:hypothetical protein